MRPSYQTPFIRLVAVTALMVGGAACSSPDAAIPAGEVDAELTPAPLSDISQTAKAEKSTGDLSTDLNVSAKAATPIADCFTWQAYQSSVAPEDRLLPSMPQGFTEGCAFLEGMTMAPHTYILREGIPLEQVFDKDALANPPAPGELPVSEGNDAINFNVLDELIASGDVVTYYEACTTIGRYEENCADYSQYRPYVLSDQPPTACFQGNCLRIQSDMAAADLADLWEFWRAPLEDPARNALRRQYETIDFDTLPAELRDRALQTSELEALVMEAFGRATLGEAEKPTVITVENYGEVVTVVNEGVADDSIGGYRYRLEFESFDGDTKRLIWVGQQHYCWRTQEWTTELCP